MSIHSEFDEWLARQTITLHGSQHEAIHALLDPAFERAAFFKSRAIGVSYGLRLLEEFLKSRPLEVPRERR